MPLEPADQSFTVLAKKPLPIPFLSSSDLALSHIGYLNKPVRLAQRRFTKTETAFHAARYAKQKMVHSPDLILS
jgi:hypothetical protein